MLETNLEDPLAGNDYMYIEKIISSTTQKHTDVIYVIIQNPKGVITITNLISFSSKDAQYLQKHFYNDPKSISESKLTPKNLFFLREYFLSDITYSQNEINKILLKIPSLKSLTTLEQIDQQEKNINNTILKLEHKISPQNSASPTYKQLLKKYKQKIATYNHQLDQLNQLSFFMKIIQKNYTLIEKMPANNIIYEVQIPLKNDFGTLKIGVYSTPKQGSTFWFTLPLIKDK